jgi:tetrahydromethanopterin S-methyltransferase subunit E
MKAYVATTGLVFGLLFVLHVWRVMVEGTQLAKDPFWILITVAAAALSIWACIVLRRAPRS